MSEDKYDQILTKFLNAQFDDQKEGIKQGLKITIEPSKTKIVTYNASSNVFWITTGIGVIFANKIILDRNEMVMKVYKGELIYQCVIDQIKNMEINGFVQNTYLQYVTIKLN
jgi:hypothetical protein